VFENRVLRGVFGPEREEVTGAPRKLLNEELHNCHSFLYVIRMIQPRRIIWQERVLRMGKI
jgi:hypothetical protein